MQDFNQYVNQTGDLPKGSENILKMVKDLAGKFDGKDQNELLKAIYQEAEKGKRNGTLTNAQIDAFAQMLSPLLDDKKRKILKKITNELKKI